MGIMLDPNQPLPPGPEQEALLRAVTGELTDKGFVVALDVKTGKPVWECPNPFRIRDHVSYCTPSMVTVDGV